LLSQGVVWSAAQPRYHYVGPALLAIIICLMVNEVSRFLVKPWLREPVAIAVMVAVLVGQVAQHKRVDHHDRARAETQSVLENIDFLAQHTPAGADLCIRNQRFRAIGVLLSADPVAFPGWAALFAIAHPVNTIHGKTVHFIETNPRVLLAARAQPQKRMAALLVSPDRLPAHCNVF
jgi:hypothetical protein